MEAVRNAMTVTEAAARLGMTPNEVRALIASRQLRAFSKTLRPNPDKPRWRVMPEWIDEFVAARSNVRVGIPTRTRRGSYERII